MTLDTRAGRRNSGESSGFKESGRQTAGEITGLLRDWSEGDEQALERLMGLIYDELRRHAAAQLRRERPDHTLQTSALIHEAYLRLVEQRHVDWQNRTHFFGIAAQMMRRILVNHARDRVTAKRGGGVRPLPVTEAMLVSDEHLTECLAVDEALEALARDSPQQAKAVELRYFGGLNRQEIAEVLGISVPTVDRRLRVARAWLCRHLEGGSRQDGASR